MVCDSVLGHEPRLITTFELHLATSLFFALAEASLAIEVAVLAACCVLQDDNRRLRTTSAA